MDIVTLGEILVDMFPAELGRRLTEVSAFRPKPGGAPANVAVAAARLGKRAAFIGKVGDDAFGHHLADVLAREGVDVRGIRYDEQARTTMAFIALPDENTAEFVFYRNPGADMLLRADELDTALLHDTKAFHFGSLSLTDEDNRRATIEAVAIARQAGALISYDVNYRPSLWHRPEEALERALAMLPQVDLLKVNEKEVALLSRRDKIDPTNLDELKGAAQALLEHGPSLVVVTLGPNGSYFQTAEGGEYIPPFRVETVDATGCGDAFIAGLLSQLIASSNWREQLTPTYLREAVRYANAVGALTALTLGVIPALPTASQVDEFLRKQS